MATLFHIDYGSSARWDCRPRRMPVLFGCVQARALRFIPPSLSRAGLLCDCQMAMSATPGRAARGEFFPDDR